MKTFLSIGTGPGIGLATAERFAREGFRVILSARSDTTTRDLADQLGAKGYEAKARSVDAGISDGIASLVSEIESTFGGIDVLHFNVAAMRKATLAEQPRETFNADLAVNIGGAMVAIQAIAPGMFARGSGTILMTSGGFALHPHPAFLSLSVGKAGLRALAQAIFEAFKEQGVHVAAVTVSGYVLPGSKAADAIAEQFWQLHRQPTGAWDMEGVYSMAG